MNQVINQPRSKLSYDEMLHYHNRTMEELDAMPAWVDVERRTNSITSTSAVPALLLDVQLRQYLLLLHLPFAQQADINERYRYSKMVCLNAANIILNHHFKLAASDNRTLNHLRDDVFRAALAMCHSIIFWNAAQGQLLIRANRNAVLTYNTQMTYWYKHSGLSLLNKLTKPANC
jgi:hypothetical protein